MRKASWLGSNWTREGKHAFAEETASAGEFIDGIAWGESLGEVK